MRSDSSSATLEKFTYENNNNCVTMISSHADIQHKPDTEFDIGLLTEYLNKYLTIYDLLDIWLDIDLISD